MGVAATAGSAKGAGRDEHAYYRKCVANEARWTSSRSDECSFIEPSGHF